MAKPLKVAYFAGGSKDTLKPFYALVNSKHNLNIPVKQFIDYLKLQRDSKTSMEMRYFRS